MANKQYVSIYQTGHSPRDIKILHNGKQIEGVRAIDIRMRPDEITTAFIELYCLDVSLFGDVEARFIAQGKEIEKIIYQDGSVFPPPMEKLSSVELNRKVMEEAGISRIH